MDRTISEDGDKVTYTVHGELFFASSNDLVYQFDYPNDPGFVVIDLTTAHIWDASTVAALDAVIFKYENRGSVVEVIGANEYSIAMRDRLAGRLDATH
jgi:SulP family sulfate permease